MSFCQNSIPRKFFWLTFIFWGGFLLNAQSTLAQVDQELFLKRNGSLMMARGADLIKRANTVLENAQVMKKNAESTRQEALLLKSQGEQLIKQTSQEMVTLGHTMLKQSKTMMENAGGLDQNSVSMEKNGRMMKKNGDFIMKNGFLMVWQGKITRSAPMTLAAGHKMPMKGHTTMKMESNSESNMSTKSRMNQNGQSGMKLGGKSKMTMPMQNKPADLDLSTSKLSEAGKYYVHIESQLYPLEINKIHNWNLIVTTAAGVPVPEAQVMVDGEMKGHAHGLPTVPQVSKHSEKDKYLVEGMKFQMSGWWTISFTINSKFGEDRVIFQLDL